VKSLLKPPVQATSLLGWNRVHLHIDEQDISRVETHIDTPQLVKASEQ
jgi:hypothetical protein